MEHDNTDQLFYAMTADLQAQYDARRTVAKATALDEAIIYLRNLFYSGITKTNALDEINEYGIIALQQGIINGLAKEIRNTHPELIEGELYVDSSGTEEGIGSYVIIDDYDDSDPKHRFVSQLTLPEGDGVIGEIAGIAIIPLPSIQDESSYNGGIQEASNKWGLVMLLHDAYLLSDDYRTDFEGRTIAIPLIDDRLFLGKPVYQEDEAVRMQDATYTIRHALQPAYLDIENQLNYEEHEENQNAREAHACARREAIEQLKLALDGIKIIQDTQLRVKAVAHGIGDKSTEIYSLDDAEVLFDSPNIIKVEDKGWRVVYELSLVHIDGQHQPVYVFPEMFESVVRLENQAVVTDANE